MKKVSVILIDWGVRESFHAIYYLNKQTIPRRDYEIIWIEYYSHRPEPLQNHANQGNLDKWIVLDKTGMYEKHLIINEGVAASEGEIIVIPDSDAVFPPTFIESIITTFEENKNEDIILYLDEARSDNRSFYPFKNPSWDEVMAAPGLINWDSVAKKPHGLATTHDIIHHRNYGSCFCARRKDVIEAGGCDEHSSYHSVFCGFYELGFRMVNKGYREIWHQSEWLLHVWHPWVTSGETMGESDGLGMNSMALEIRRTGRVAPLVENEKIGDLRTGGKDKPLLKAPVHKPSRTPNSPVRKGATFRHNIYKFKHLAKSLLTPVKINRVLIVTEYNRTTEELVVKPNEFAGFADRTEIFTYAPPYHTYGQQKMSEMLLQTCKNFQPELIIFLPLQNSDEPSLHDVVEPTKDVMKRIVNELGIKAYVYHLNSTKCERYNEWFSLVNYVGIIDSLSEFDKYAGNPKVIRGYPAAYPLDFYDRNLDRDTDVIFWGSVPINSKREECVEFLRDNGIKVDTREFRVPVLRYAEMLNRSKISLSLCRDGEAEGRLRRRAFETMACRSLLLEDSIAATRRLFDADKDFVIFRNKEELLQKVKYYLQHEEKRQAIAQSGYEKVTNVYNARNMWADTFTSMGFEDKKHRYTHLKIAYIVFSLLKLTLIRVLLKILPQWLKIRIVYVASRCQEEKQYRHTYSKAAYIVYLLVKLMLMEVLGKVLPQWLQVRIKSTASRWHIKLTV